MTNKFRNFLRNNYVLIVFIFISQAWILYERHTLKDLIFLFLLDMCSICVTLFISSLYRMDNAETIEEVKSFVEGYTKGVDEQIENISKEISASLYKNARDIFKKSFENYLNRPRVKMLKDCVGCSFHLCSIITDQKVYCRFDTICEPYISREMRADENNDLYVVDCPKNKPAAEDSTANNTNPANKDGEEKI